MSFIKCQWWSQDFRHSPNGNLSRVNSVQSRIKSIIITASSIGPCSRISSNPHVPAVASAAPHVPAVYPAQKTAAPLLA